MMSREALAHTGRRRISAEPVLEPDAEAPAPFADPRHLVVSALALNHVEDWERVFTKFARILRLGGFLVLSTCCLITGSS
ncbi:hypothetical protein GCM10009000_079490 [Halobacterium noricense]